MRISDWSSDVCSSDLARRGPPAEDTVRQDPARHHAEDRRFRGIPRPRHHRRPGDPDGDQGRAAGRGLRDGAGGLMLRQVQHEESLIRSEEHTSELQSLMRTSYAVFCLKKKNMTSYAYNKKKKQIYQYITKTYTIN